MYKKLPVRRDILEALLESDLIGFHTFDYARHFTKSCTRILGLETTPNQVIYRDNAIPIGLFPVGIDPTKFYERLETEAVKKRIEQLKERFDGRKVCIVSLMRSLSPQFLVLTTLTQILIGIDRLGTLSLVASFSYPI